ncbi:MAG: GtrA family protein [Bacteroidales bacterium]|nr:GtrA family protein [Bacteroidales bacterium]
MKPRQLFRDRTNNMWVQLFRYGISGFSATAVDFLILTVLTEAFGEDLLLVWTAIAFISGLAVTYLLSTHWVFDSHRFKSKAAEALVFVLIGIVGLGLTELLMWLFAEKMGLFYLLSKLIASVLVFIWNFTAKKFIVFHK